MGIAIGVAVVLMGVFILVITLTVKGSLSIWAAILIYLVVVSAIAVLMGKTLKAARKRQQSEAAKMVIDKARQELADCLAKTVEYEKQGFRLKGLHHCKRGWNGYWEIDSLLQDAFLTAIGTEVKGKLNDPEEAFEMVATARSLICRADRLVDDFVSKRSANGALLANLKRKLEDLSIFSAEALEEGAEKNRISALIEAARQRCVTAAEKNSMEAQLFEEAEEDLLAAKVMTEIVERHFAGAVLGALVASD